MYRSTIVIVALLFSIILATRIQAKPEADSGANKAGTLIIVLIGLGVSDNNLELRYQIRNGSGHDIWICDSINVHGGQDFEVYLAEDGQNLMIRRRLDVPQEVSWMEHPYGRYVRLPAGQNRIECLLLPLSLKPNRVIKGRRPARGTEYARRLILEIGYYVGDLPGMIYDILREAEKLGCASLDHAQT